MTLPGGRESVGSAYLRIFADGSDLDRSIKDEFDANNKIFEEQGNKSHAAYKKGFDDEEKKHPFLDPKLADKSLRDLNTKIRNSKGQFDATGQFLGSAMAQKIRATLIKELGDKDLGNRIFENISKGALQSGSIDEFEKRLKNLGPEISRASKDIAKDQEDLRRATDKVTNSVRDLGDEGEKATRKIKNGTEDAVKSGTKLDQILKSITKTDFGKFFGQGSRNNFLNSFGNLIGIAARSLSFLTIGSLVELRNFGNAFGNAGKEGESALKGLASGVGSFVAKILNGLGAVSAGILVLPVALKIALAGVQVFLGPIAALITDLAGAVVALSSTIGFGLVFAVGSLLPLLAPLVVGVGAVALAFTGLDKDAKAALKIQVKPLTDQLHLLQQAARDGLFGKNSINIKNEVKAAKPIIASLQPLIKATSAGIAKSFLGFTKQLGGPAFKSFEKSMTTFIPNALYKFGKIGANSFLGITGLIKDLLPFANRLLNEFQRGTNEFAKFTNSAAGSNKISKFMVSAGASAHLLYRVLVDTGKVLGDLLSAGKSTGDSLFGSIDKSLQTFDKFLNSPRGQKALAGFFAQTKTFLGALGNLVGGIGSLFGALNNGQSQNILNTLLSGLGGFLALIAKNVPTAIPLLKDFATGASAVFKALGAVAGFIAAHEGLFKPLLIALGALYVATKLVKLELLGTFTLGILGSIKTISLALATSSTGFLSIAQRFQGAFTGLAIGIGSVYAAAKVGGAGGAAIGGVGGLIGGALFGASVGGAPGAIIGGVLGGLAGLVSHFWGGASRDADKSAAAQIAALARIQTAADNLKGAIDQDGVAYGNAARAAAIAALQKPVKGAGGFSDIGAASNIGISSKQIADAIGGDNAAATKIDTAVKKFLAQRASAIAAMQKIVTTSQNTISALQAQQQSGPLSAADTTLLKGLQAGLPAQQKALADLIGNTNNYKAALGDLVQQLPAYQAGVKTDIVNSDQIASASTKGLTLATRSATTQVIAYGTALTGTGNAAKLNNQLISDHVTAINKAATAQLAAGVPIAKVTANFEAQRNALEKQLITAGFSKEAVDKLVFSLKGVPAKILSKVTVDTAKAHDDILGINGKLDSLENRKIQVNTSLTGNALSELNKIAALAAQLRNTQINIKANEIGNIKTAVGGKFDGAQYRIIAEAGPEAVVPLRRPLSQVDPSVRALSAYAQGIPFNGSQQKTETSTGQTRGGPTIVIGEGGALVSTPSTNANAIVSEMLARFATDGYGS